MEDHGLYKENTDGTLTLLSLDEKIHSEEYRILEGTSSIERDAFFDLPFLKKIYIPASMKDIPDGCLCNAASWASEEKGISEIELSPKNESFEIIDCFFCRKLEAGRWHLLRVLETPEHITIPDTVVSIGEGAFSGRFVKSVTLDCYGTTIWFPAGHRFYLEVLLGKFGKNGRIFDFKEYDRLLLFDHFNPERIHMLCGRLSNPVEMEENMQMKIRENALLHMEDVMEAVIKNGDTELLDLLAGVSLFTEENIGALTDQVGRSLRKDLMFWMMDYKNRCFGADPDDLMI